MSDMKEVTEQFLSWKDNQPHNLSRYSAYNPDDNVIARVLRREGRDILHDYIFGRNLVVETGEQYYVQRMTVSTIDNNFSAGTMIVNNPSSADTPNTADDFSDVNSPIAGSYSSIQSTNFAGGTGHVDQESVGLVGTGSSATGTLNVTAGVIDSITITVGGSGYVSGEAITLSGATGTGGSGVATLPSLTSVALNNTDTGNAGGGQYIITWKQSWTAPAFVSGANNIQGGCTVDTNAPGVNEPLLNHWNFDQGSFSKQNTEPLDVWVNHTLLGV